MAATVVIIALCLFGGLLQHQQEVALVAEDQQKKGNVLLGWFIILGLGMLAAYFQHKYHIVS